MFISSKYISVEFNVLFSKWSTWSTCLLQRIFAIRVDRKHTFIETITCGLKYTLCFVQIYIFWKHNYSIYQSLIFLPGTQLQSILHGTCEAIFSTCLLHWCCIKQIRRFRTVPLVLLYVYQDCFCIVLSDLLTKYIFRMHIDRNFNVDSTLMTSSF